MDAVWPAGMLSYIQRCKKYWNKEHFKWSLSWLLKRLWNPKHSEYWNLKSQGGVVIWKIQVQIPAQPWSFLSDPGPVIISQPHLLHLTQSCCKDKRREGKELWSHSELLGARVLWKCGKLWHNSTHLLWRNLLTEMLCATIYLCWIQLSNSCLRKCFLVLENLPYLLTMPTKCQTWSYCFYNCSKPSKIFL